MMIKKMVEIINKVGAVASLGVATRPTELEDKSVEIEPRVVEVVIRVVIRNIFLQF